jgi:hypothetical protein
LESLQTAEIHRLAGEELSQPADLLTLGGVSLADLLDEVGNVDTAAVADAITRLVESRPGLSRNPKVLATDATQGMGGGNGKPKADWKTFLNIQ